MKAEEVMIKQSISHSHSSIQYQINALLLAINTSTNQEVALYRLNNDTLIILKNICELLVIK